MLRAHYYRETPKTSKQVDQGKVRTMEGRKEEKKGKKGREGKEVNEVGQVYH